MKWSEQMRELISVDENFNQLVFNVNTKELFINGKFIAKTLTYPSTDVGPGGVYPVPGVGTSAAYVVEYEDYKKIIKKYPSFTDVKFLLNCIIKRDYYYTKVSGIYYYADYIAIQNPDGLDTLVIYIQG